MYNAIYLDYNATTPVDSEVLQEMLPWFTEKYGNPSSGYAIGIESKLAVELARKRVAQLINARPEEIIFTSCATESNNLAIRGIASNLNHKGKHIVISAIEHPAVMQVCRHLESRGFEISVVPVDSCGMVHVSELEKALRPTTILISVMHANNEVGTIQPIKEISALSKKHGIIMHTDAAQSLGKVPVDVNELGVDLLTIAGHKLYAPKGIGALYIRKGTPIKQILYGAGQENGLRPGTENVAYAVALGKACEIALRDFTKNTMAMKNTKEYLLEGLRSKLNHRLILNTLDAPLLPNTMSISIKGVDAHQLTAQLSGKLMLSTGSACHADSIAISPVLKAMNLNPDLARATLRISTGKSSTIEEMEWAISILLSLIE